MAFSVSFADMTFSDASFAGVAYADELLGFPMALQKMVSHISAAFKAPVTGSIAIGTGTKSGTVYRNLPIYVGQPGRYVSRANSANYMRGSVTAYTASTGAISMSVTSIGGSGTLSDFDFIPEQPTTLSISGLPAVTTLATTDAVPAVASGTDSQITLANFAATLPQVIATVSASSTNTVLSCLRLDRESTGTPGVGIGSMLEFAAETTPSNTEIGATISAVATTITAAAEAFDIVLSTMSAGAAATEAFRVLSSNDVRVVNGVLAGLSTGTPTRRLHAVSDDATNNDATILARFEHRTTGTPAIGIGAGVEFVAETASNNYEIGAGIEAITTAIGSNAEAFDLVFLTMAGGATAAERMRVRSDGRATLTARPTAGLDAATRDVAEQMTAFRNKIINGDMRINQLASAAIIPNPAAPPLDRWMVFARNRFNAQQSGAGTFLAMGGSTYSLDLAVTSAAGAAATDSIGFYQNVEGYNALDLFMGTAGAQPFGVSFKAVSSLAGTYCVAIHNWNGSATDRSYVATYALAANTQTAVFLPIPGDTTGTWFKDNSVGVSLWFDLGSGSNFNTTAGAWGAGNYHRTTGQANWCGTAGATFKLTDVQLERLPAVTAIQTPFERRPIGTEWDLCKRYYENSWQNPPGASPLTNGEITSLGHPVANYRLRIPFTTRKRTTPTIVLYDTGGIAGQFAYYNGSIWTTSATMSYVGSSPSGIYLGHNIANSLETATAWTANAEIN